MIEGVDDQGKDSEKEEKEEETARKNEFKERHSEKDKSCVIIAQDGYWLVIVLVVYWVGFLRDIWVPYISKSKLREMSCFACHLS